jgi:hypothetical protein
VVLQTVEASSCVVYGKSFIASQHHGIRARIRVLDTGMSKSPPIEPIRRSPVTVGRLRVSYAQSGREKPGMREAEIASRRVEQRRRYDPYPECAR